ncbi:hypothetical protein GQ457_01G006160 [Hibiscus cannabinus]
MTYGGYAPVEFFESLLETIVKPGEPIDPTHERKIASNFIFSDGTILLHSVKEMYNTKFPHLPPVVVIRCKGQV